LNYCQKTFLVAFCFFSLIMLTPVLSQTRGMVLEGSVHGYEYSRTGLFKKQEEISFMGSMDSAVIEISWGDSLLRKSFTGENGEYQFLLGYDSLFEVKVSKAGYHQNMVLIDTRAIPRELKEATIHFSGLQFLLNKVESSGKRDLYADLGRLYFNSNTGCFEYAVVADRDSKKGIDHLKLLLQMAVEKNRHSLYAEEQKGESVKNFEAQEIKSSETGSESSPASLRMNISKDFSLNTFSATNNLTEQQFRDRREEIFRARFQLELDRQRAESDLDSILLESREKELLAAEASLENAHNLIIAKNAEIKASRRATHLLFSTVAILLLALTLGILYYREKRKKSEALAKKNRNMQESLRYARKIQRNILTEESELHNHLPESFIFYQPKEAVSGDFYWFSEKQGKMLLGVLDCTGHGVPGAFVSIVAHNLLNEIILDKDVYDPAEILTRLHHQLNQALHKEKNKKDTLDGLDMALCRINMEQSKLIYAGAMNPLYILTDKNIEVVKPDYHSIGWVMKKNKKDTIQFHNKTIYLNSSKSFYMFTDGITDQFGGEENKKFSTTKLKNVLSDIQKLNMQDQKSYLRDLMHFWRGDRPQVDDMLVVGFKLSVPSV